MHTSHGLNVHLKEKDNVEEKTCLWRRLWQYVCVCVCVLVDIFIKTPASEYPHQYMQQ